ncbi:FusB/FusC family EF-G-binding protein [Psychrobacillus sp. FJAT-21963]|uniref:FusB/FusC family EF-G-binding protein n=1 Tax=Psychrobacillus sp. FJAT-21963 TaxID=1712028 RepID=UPI0006F3E0AA|nr:FusB/FusC family EF-G-binding protein [Psychrobacillus sp. FJAT-21963]KQL32424.1 ferrous iron transporter A [Psychrobacillus sp. FJAT-21963]
MNPFIKSDQYNFIKYQTQNLINGHATVNDQAVLNALKSLTIEKVLGLFEELHEDQKLLLNPIVEVKEKSDAEVFLEKIKPYVVPFREIKEQTIKKLFPKAKKLKMPSLEQVDFSEISYLGWLDKGTNKKYLIVERHGKLIGISGGYKNSNKKGICTICNRFEEIGMFTSATKGATQDAYIKRGNYICQDSHKCNQNLLSHDKLDEFVELIIGS